MSFPRRTTWATDTNFSDPGTDWDATPTREEPPAGVKASGIVPDDPLPAQYINWVLGNQAESINKYLEGLVTNFPYKLGANIQTGIPIGTDVMISDFCPVPSGGVDFSGQLVKSYNFVCSVTDINAAPDYTDTITTWTPDGERHRFLSGPTISDGLGGGQGVKASFESPRGSLLLAYRYSTSQDRIFEQTASGTSTINFTDPIVGVGPCGTDVYTVVYNAGHYILRQTSSGGAFSTLTGPLSGSAWTAGANKYVITASNGTKINFYQKDTSISGYFSVTGNTITGPTTLAFVASGETVMDVIYDTLSQTWIMAVRQSSTVTRFYNSSDGASWTLVSTITLSHALVAESACSSMCMFGEFLVASFAGRLRYSLDLGATWADGNSVLYTATPLGDWPNRKAWPTVKTNGKQIIHYTDTEAEGSLIIPE